MPFPLPPMFPLTLARNGANEMHHTTCPGREIGPCCNDLSTSRSSRTITSAMSAPTTVGKPAESGAGPCGSMASLSIAPLRVSTPSRSSPSRLSCSEPLMSGGEGQSTLQVTRRQAFGMALAALVMPQTETVSSAGIPAAFDSRDDEYAALARAYLREREVAADAETHLLTSEDIRGVGGEIRAWETIREPWREARDQLFAAMMEGAVEADRCSPAEFDRWTCLPARALILPSGEVIIAYPGGLQDPNVRDETTLIVVEAEDVFWPVAPTSAGVVIP